MIFPGCSCQSRTGKNLPFRSGLAFQAGHIPILNPTTCPTRARTNRGNIEEILFLCRTQGHQITCFWIFVDIAKKLEPMESPEKQPGPSTSTRFPTKAPSRVDSTRSPRRFTGESVDHLQPHQPSSRHRQGGVLHLLPCLTFAHSPRTTRPVPASPQPREPPPRVPPGSPSRPKCVSVSRHNCFAI